MLASCCGKTALREGNSDMSLAEPCFLNAKGAEAFAEERKGQHFSACLSENLGDLCVKNDVGRARATGADGFNYRARYLHLVNHGRFIDSDCGGTFRRRSGGIIGAIDNYSGRCDGLGHIFLNRKGDSSLVIVFDRALISSSRKQLKNESRDSPETSHLRRTGGDGGRGRSQVGDHGWDS